LGDATSEGVAVGFDIGTGCDKRAVSEVGAEPGEGDVLDAVPGGESFQKDGVVNGVECCREVEETQTGDLSVADGADDGVVDGQKDGFSRMEHGVGGLERVRE